MYLQLFYNFVKTVIKKVNRGVLFNISVLLKIFHPNVQPITSSKTSTSQVTHWRCAISFFIFFFDNRGPFIKDVGNFAGIRAREMFIREMVEVLVLITFQILNFSLFFHFSHFMVIVFIACTEILFFICFALETTLRSRIL